MAKKVDKDELFEKLKKLYLRDMGVIREWRLQARRDYNFYNGHQFSDDDMRKFADLGINVQPFNRIFPVVNAVTGSEIQNRRTVRYIPRKQGDAIVDELLTNAAQWFRDVSHADTEDSDVFADAVICGLGGSEVLLDYETEAQGLPTINRLDPFAIVWDTNSKKANFLDAHHLFYEARITLEEAKAMFPDENEEDLNADWIDGLGDTLYKDYGLTATDDVDIFVTIVEARYKELEYYWVYTDLETGESMEVSNKDARKLKEMGYQVDKRHRYIVKKAFLGSKVLGDVEEPLAPRGSFGWNFITGYLDDYTRHYYGLVRSMVGAQSTYNDFWANMIRTVKSQVTPGLYIEENALLDVNSAGITLGDPAAVTILKDRGLSKIRVKDVPSLPPDYYNLFKESERALTQTTGLSEEFLGTRGVTQAGILEQQRKQSSLNILSSIFDSLSRYKRGQGKDILYLIQNFLSDGRLIRIVGKEGEKYIPLMQSDQTNLEYDIKVEDVPNTLNDKQSKFEMIMQIATSFKEYLPPEVMLKLLEYTPLDASLIAEIKEIVIKSKEEAEQKEQMAQMAKMGGGQQSPNPLPMQPQEGQVEMHPIEPQAPVEPNELGDVQEMIQQLQAREGN